MRTFLLLYALLLLGGCATRVSQPVHVGQGVYMVAGSTSSFVTSTSDVVSELESRASTFCASSGGKALAVVRFDTTAPELVRFPEGKMQFRCL